MIEDVYDHLEIQQFQHREADLEKLLKRLKKIDNPISKEARRAIKQLAAENSGMRAVTERQLADKQREIDALKKTCEEYSIWLGEKQTKIDQLEDRCKEADRRAKPYGMDEWKGGEEARASYIEKITELEKLAAEQAGRLRAQELSHQAEIDRHRKALGIFLTSKTKADGDEAITNAQRVLGGQGER